MGHTRAMSGGLAPRRWRVMKPDPPRKTGTVQNGADSPGNQLWRIGVLLATVDAAPPTPAPVGLYNERQSMVMNREDPWMCGRRIVPVIVLALLMPSGSWSQAMPPDTSEFRRSPLELLLEHGASLDLTSEQLARIDVIRARLAEQNEPLVGRMMTLRAQWQHERLAAREAGAMRETPRLRRIRAAALPVHERIQRNNRAAMHAVNQLLTPDQRVQLRRIVEQGRRGGPPGPGALRPGAAGPGNAGRPAGGDRPGGGR
jgi:hypothetical protein